MTTAEPPEPLILQQSEFIICKQILQQIDGPAARHSCPVVFISGSKSSHNLTAPNNRAAFSYNRALICFSVRPQSRMARSCS